MSSSTTPIALPTPPATGFSPLSGAPITKLDRLKVMSPDDWEQFVNEWASSALKTVQGYSEVHNASGGGDMGRDVIAYRGSMTGPYDNYQCKHYDHPLAPGDIWSELGKLCYWTFKGEYGLPDRYLFVAPRGVGPTVLRYLERPLELRADLLAKWDQVCSNEITKKDEVTLTPELRAHIESIDFSIFGAVPPTTLIEEHANTPYHVSRFGFGLPTRVDEGGPSETIEATESCYVRQLFDVYGEHAGNSIAAAEDLDSLDETYRRHFKVSREEFFSAECLDKFSRDYLPPASFKALQIEVEDGIREVVDEDYDKALAKVRATTKHAKTLPTDGHPLNGVIRLRDKAGICHQLVNDGRLVWIVR